MEGIRTSALFLMVAAGITLQRCDTSHSVVSPSKNYFLKYYGGQGSQTGVDVVVNTDGSFILFGTTQLPNQGVHQLYLVKADALGNVIWEKILGGNRESQARDIELTKDGQHIVILANSLTSPGNRDILLMRFNVSDGTRIPADSVLVSPVDDNNFAVNADEDALSVTQIDDGGFIVAGSSGNLTATVPPHQRDAICVRFDNNLVQAPNSWRNATGQGDVNVATKVFQASNTPQKYYVFGYSNWKNTFAVANYNFWVIEINMDGEAIGNTLAIGSSLADEKLGAVAVLPSQDGGGFFLGGISTDANGNDDVFIAHLTDSLRLDSTDLRYPKPTNLKLKLGHVSTESTNTNESPNVNVAASQTSGYFVLSNEESTGNNNLLLAKINSADGTLAWNSPVIYGGAGNDFIGSVTELPDGKLLIIGTMTVGAAGSGTRMVLMKVNKDGQFSD